MSDPSKQQDIRTMTIAEADAFIKKVSEQAVLQKAVFDTFDELSTVLAEVKPLIKAIAEKKTTVTLPSDQKIGSSWEIEMPDGRKITITRKS